MENGIIICSQVTGAAYSCICESGWTGRNCSVLSDVCASNPCQNGATCSKDSEGYRCECTDQFTGFRCDQPQEGCGGPLLGDSGVIRYPQEEGETYPHGRDCAWVISTAPDKVISISFTRLSLEPSNKCLYDFLALHDGPEASSQMIAKMCHINQLTNDSITTTHNQMYIWFHSDSSVSSDGFEAVWKAVDPLCGGNLEGRDHGVITSPGFPGVYPHNRDCAWTVTVSSGNIILFTFGHLAMEAHTNCSYDYLKIHDGLLEEDPVLQTYCDSQDPAPLRTTGPYALVRFHSDRGSSDRGFHITYAAIAGTPGCGGAFTTAQGVVISPNYPNPYQRDAQCVWTITVKETEKITFTFTTIDLEDHRGCSWDYVQV
ncbi:Cubilin [Lamellibrachia satsuma]|nr:Cubilin [Lamellibrachia satsuma]